MSVLVCDANLKKIIHTQHIIVNIYLKARSQHTVGIIDNADIPTHFH
jgi:hypothetical protein